jgi:hypothetical protein
MKHHCALYSTSRNTFINRLFTDLSIRLTGFDSHEQVHLTSLPHYTPIVY